MVEVEGKIIVDTTNKTGIYTYRAQIVTPKKYSATPIDLCVDLMI